MHSKVDKDAFVQKLKTKHDTKQEDAEYLKANKVDVQELLSKHNDILADAPKKLFIMGPLGPEKAKPAKNWENDGKKSKFESAMEG